MGIKSFAFLYNQNKSDLQLELISSTPLLLDREKRFSTIRLLDSVILINDNGILKNQA